MIGQATLTDIVAIAADANQQDDVFAIAVRDHSRFLFQVAYSVLRNRDDAEDAVQEGFLRALRHERQFRQAENRRAWLARTVWHIALDRTRRRPEPSLDTLSESAATALRETEFHIAQTHDQQSGVEASLISEQGIVMLRALIATLPPGLRAVVTLSTVEEMNSSEIAAVLEIPDATVRTRLLRARQMLKEKLIAVLDRHSRSQEQSCGTKEAVTYEL